MTDWRNPPRIPTRNLTIYSGEDVDIIADFRDAKTRQPVAPPEGTEVWFQSGTDTFPCVIDGTSFSLHMEAADVTLDHMDPWWLWIRTPDTEDGRPKAITKGTVQYVEQ
ncbi:hypothetical protein [Gordonia sp. (in: high G+C Gram-positive bacteria)]|uniref:LtfC-like domain-containing protein n=1 Tax=Gordonia sp. (in: high G+C Gram-positive bacteria) TaxID=84139 RepID=UPI0026048633|nr:hypothetical protein [Gordonia sp. (in: high G+C Gram-positive bacteria)]